MIVNGNVISGFMNFGLSLDGIEKCISANGARQDYRYMFMEQDWSLYNFRLGLIKPKDKNSYMFYQYRGETLPGGIDFSLASSDTLDYLFAYSNLREIYDMNIPAPDLAKRMFLSCTKLITIEKFRVSKDTKYIDTFLSCNNLVNLTIDGVIGQNGFGVKSCKNLSRDSLLSISEALEDKSADTSGATWTITFGSANIAKLETEEIAEINKKGWVLK